MNRRTPEELEQLAKDVITLNTPDEESPTPRTDAEHAKTLTPAYEYESAETEAWEFARKLEKELRDLQRAKTNIPFQELF
ncbi:MAG: hypothetical protein DRH97_00830 [Chloroflexi bacterium]|nr:MAG: hypothetical protein DRH97_00830 [Chloroflexota bacterium]